MELLLRLHRDKLVALFDVCAAKALAALETGGLARDVGLSLVTGARKRNLDSVEALAEA